MRIIGIMLIAIGLILGGQAYRQPTTITTESHVIGRGEYAAIVPGQTVHNLDLADRRHVHLAACGLLIVSGVILFGFGVVCSRLPAARPTPKNCPECAEPVQVVARVCAHCGYRFRGGEPANAQPETPPAAPAAQPVPRPMTWVEAARAEAE